MQVPFHRVYLSGREINYIQDCIERGSLAGDGYYTHRVQDWMEKSWGTYRAFLTTSATAALEMAMLCIDLQPGDEVIMPAFTFVSTANAVVLRGAIPVFAEVDPDNMNLDATDAARRVTARTRAIIPVHYGGVSCNMQAIIKLAADHNLTVVEDAAQAVGARYEDRFLGTIGQLGCLSFHGTKNVTSGEGGALLLNQPDNELLKRSEMIWEKGTDRSSFRRGQVDRYTWREIGSSFAPADLLAAFLNAQLEDIDLITEQRRVRYERYRMALKPYQERGLLKLASIPGYAVSNYHLFYFICPSESQRDQMLNGLKEQGVETAFHFLPLHQSPMGQRLGYHTGDLPVTEDMSSRLLRLPLYPDLSVKEQEFVIEKVSAILEKW